MLKKIKDYIKGNNNERNNLLLNRNQLYSKLKGTENELYET